MSEEVSRLRSLIARLNLENQSLTEEINLHSRIRDRQDEIIDDLKKELKTHEDKTRYQKRMISKKEIQIIENTKMIEHLKQILKK